MHCGKRAKPRSHRTHARSFEVRVTVRRSGERTTAAALCAARLLNRNILCCSIRQQTQTHNCKRARALSHNVQPQSRRASEHGPESWRPGHPSRAPGCVSPSAASSSRPHARWQAQSRAHGLPPTCSRWQRSAAERAKATRACRRWATAPARA